MENKNAAILAMAVAVALVAGGAYAMGTQAPGNGYSPGTTYWYGMGPRMMGGPSGYAEGMMSGHGYYQGMMGNSGYSMYQYMEHYRNSTPVP